MPMSILICTIENRQYAFDLDVVERSVLAVAITPIPQAPKHILGAINLHGQIIPVVNLRSQLGLPPRDIDINDHYVICRSGNKTIALWVDGIQQVRSCSDEELIPAQDIMPELTMIRCALKEGNDIILIVDLEKMLLNRPVLANVECNAC